VKKIDVHRAWAPEDGTWSAWVKPILFASMAEDVEPRPLPDSRSTPLVDEFEAKVLRPMADAPRAVAALPVAPATSGHAAAPTQPSASTSWAMRASPPRANEGDIDPPIAVIIDLPAEESLFLGLALIRRGFRPVPLFNAAVDEQGVVDLVGARQHLVDAAAMVRQGGLRAAPAFLLDSRRHGHGRAFAPRFDNRSVCRVADFPSGDLLRKAGIRSALVVARGPLAVDVAAVVASWKRSGVDPWITRDDDGSAAASLRLWWLGLATGLAPVASLLMGLVRRGDGAYGGIVESGSAG
jgi:hypothetical protein